MEKIQIFVTHWVNKHIIELNDVLVEMVTFLEKITDYPHETIVVCYCPNGDNSIDEIYERLPNTRIEKNNRPKRPDIQPSLRNKIVDIANNCPFVILHNDTRVSAGWLESIISDFNDAESLYGKNNCIIAPRFIPYHYIPEIIEPKYPKFWESLQCNTKCLSIEKMREWCNIWNFKFNNNIVCSLPSSPFTDDGHQLMMFMSRREFFDKELGGIGECDENFVGMNYDDQDWGIRALLAGKKNLKSQRCLIGHIEGLSFFQPNILKMLTNNDKIFVQKWGKDLFDEMQTGQLWIRLHKEQQNDDRRV